MLTTNVSFIHAYEFGSLRITFILFPEYAYKLLEKRGTHNKNQLVFVVDKSFPLLQSLLWQKLFCRSIIFSFLIISFPYGNIYLFYNEQRVANINQEL